MMKLEEISVEMH